MKLILILCLLALNFEAQASIDCTSESSNLSFSTDEGVEGNLVSIQVVGLNFRTPLTFGSMASDSLTVDRDLGSTKEETVYMASNGKAMITLSLPQRIPEGKKAAASLYIKYDKQILKESLSCSDDSFEGS